MKVGQLNRRIKLRKLRKNTKAVSGEAIVELDYVIDVAAEFKGVRGAEAFESAREVSGGVGTFIIRFRPGINGSFWEIEDWAGRIWDIIGEPREIGTRSGLEIAAELRM